MQSGNSGISESNANITRSSRNGNISQESGNINKKANLVGGFYKQVAVSATCKKSKKKGKFKEPVQSQSTVSANSTESAKSTNSKVVDHTNCLLVLRERQYELDIKNENLDYLYQVRLLDEEKQEMLNLYYYDNQIHWTKRLTKEEIEQTYQQKLFWIRREYNQNIECYKDNYENELYDLIERQRVYKENYEKKLRDTKKKIMLGIKEAYIKKQNNIKNKTQKELARFKSDVSNSGINYGKLSCEYLLYPYVAEELLEFVGPIFE